MLLAGKAVVSREVSWQAALDPHLLQPKKMWAAPGAKKMWAAPGPTSSSTLLPSLELSDTKVYEPCIRAHMLEMHWMPHTKQQCKILSHGKCS